MKEIKLQNSDKVALVDDEDYERVSQLKWYWNVARHSKVSDTTNNWSLHRFIFYVTDSNIHVDHKDHNTLNNCRSNLRPCSKKQNGWNRRKRKDSCSQYKGVSGNLQTQKWRAIVTKDGKTINIGTFDSEVVAAHAYDKFALELFGEYAYLNFPDFDYRDYHVPANNSRGPNTSSCGCARLRGNRWHAHITINGKTTHIGTFDTKEEGLTACKEFKCQQQLQAS